MTVVIYETDVGKSNRLKQYVKSLRPTLTIKTYQDTKQVRTYVATHEVQIAFVNVEGVGYFLAEDLIKNYSDMDVIYLAKDGEHALRAIQLHATGYLIETYTREMIQDTMNNLQYH